MSRRGWRECTAGTQLPQHLRFEFQGAEQLATFMTSTESMSMTFMKSLSTSIASSPRPSAPTGLTSKRRSISCLVNSTQGRPWVVLPTTSAGTVPNHHRMSCTMQSVLLMDHTALAKILVFKPETVKGSHTQIHTDAHAHTRAQTQTLARARGAPCSRLLLLLRPALPKLRTQHRICASAKGSAADMMSDEGIRWEATRKPIKKWIRHVQKRRLSS